MNVFLCVFEPCEIDKNMKIIEVLWFAFVQVIGELSNAGQPMRRFVQSFVLAPQTANKYYVHVDIFRYQDDYASLPDAEEEEEKYDEGRPWKICLIREYKPSCWVKTTDL